MTRIVDSTKLRVVNLSFLNSVPFRHLRTLDWVSYEECEPAESARRLHEHECDLALIPLSEDLMHGGYLALPFGIAAQGAAESVFLFSERPINELELILIDSASLTSAVLLQLILSEDFPETFARIRFARVWAEAAEAEISGSCGALIIGDRALRLRTHYPHQLDLAAHWFEKTSLPFVFAVWAAREEVFTQHHLSLLDQHFTEGLNHSAVFARAWADDNRFDRAQAEHYVQVSLFHRLKGSALTGAKLFSERTALAGLLPFSEISFVENTTGIKRSANSARLARIARKSAFSGVLKAEPPQPDDLLGKVRDGKRLSFQDGLRIAHGLSAIDLALATSYRAEAVRNRQPDIELTFGADDAVPLEQVLRQTVVAVSEVGSRSLKVQLDPDCPLSAIVRAVADLVARFPARPVRGLNATTLYRLIQADTQTITAAVKALASGGLSEILGDDAEILVKRAALLRQPIPADDWIDAHRACHRWGIRSSAALTFNLGDSWEDRLLHLLKLRQIQDETTGFVSFTLKAPSSLRERGSPGDADYFKCLALCRLFLDNISEIHTDFENHALGTVAQEFGATQ